MYSKNKLFLIVIQVVVNNVCKILHAVVID